MILDVNQLGRIIVLHIVIGTVLYYFTPVASFAYFVAATLLGAIQNYRAWENIAAQNSQLEMFKNQVPELQDYLDKIDAVLDDAYKGDKNEGGKN
jgi:heme O synthase-like polyprenyltransferase